ncbi:hypothetical protein PANT_13c00061 [Moesziomyces antarcticus T-34]|uniref:Don3 interacting protein n=1 Tax=Pseudozyma antarctica (strain T-34) TaxID=1151754 RepID=M9MG55_PSEA3|nr:hypothetical protein PANT_13c00061 [Moesziomyces antarcticus T-34]
MSSHGVAHPRSAAGTPTQTRPSFSTARDHFSPGSSRPNAMSRSIDLEATVEAWLDALNSPLSTPSERTSTLNDIERLLVNLTDPSSRSSALVGLDHAATFWSLQATAGFSLAEALMALVYRLHLDLHREHELQATHASSSLYAATDAARPLDGLGIQMSKAHNKQAKMSVRSMSEAQHQRLHATVSELCIAITILQGLTLCSTASKRIMRRKSSLELLLQIVLADYCTQLLPPVLMPASQALTPTSPSFSLPPTPSTPASSSSSSPSKSSVTASSSADSVAEAPLSLPSGFALDLLMCVLVDSQEAQDRFAEMGGIHQIVQLSHKCADTVTTPVSTPVTATSPSLRDVAATSAARSGHIVALKQTDLLCLEFRYFWSQLLNSEPARRASLDNVAGINSAATSFYSVMDPPSTVLVEAETAAEPSTPKASLRKRASRRMLGGSETPLVETPKARGRVQAPSSTRATSEEAPSRTLDQQAGAVNASPRRLRHSTSVAELRKKPSVAKSMPPVPPLPVLESTVSVAVKPDAASSERRFASRRPATSGSGSASVRPSASALPGGGQLGERVRRSTVSEASTADGGPDRIKFSPTRPGMSSRERPRIPSPLKPRSAAQQAAELDTQRRADALTNQAIPYRRLRASTASTPFSPTDNVAAAHRDADAENCNPFSTAHTQAKPQQEARTQLRSKRSAHMLRESPQPMADVVAGAGSMRRSDTRVGMVPSESAYSLGVGSGPVKLPPSPAVRRAQLARARSLSPTKLTHLGERLSVAQPDL